MKLLRRALAAALPLVLATSFVPALHAQTAASAEPAPLSQLVRQVDIPHQMFTLKNGLRVLVHTDRKAPIVGVTGYYRVGSKHAPHGHAGVAHLYEHLKFGGSE